GEGHLDALPVVPRTRAGHQDTAFSVIAHCIAPLIAAYAARAWGIHHSHDSLPGSGLAFPPSGSLSSIARAIATINASLGTSGRAQATPSRNAPRATSPIDMRGYRSSAARSALPITRPL